MPFERRKTNENNLFDNPIDEAVGALKTAYLKNTAELVTGEVVDNLSIEEEPDSIIESDYHYPKNEEISSYFCDLMKDKVVLDLGCGVQATGYKIADFTKAKKYIGVEKHFAKTAFERTSQQKGNIPFEIIQADMSEYVQDEAHTADVIILMGVDLLIVPEKEWERLLQGIHKILSDEGRLLIGGGVGKPWDLIEGLFQKDETLEKIEGKHLEELMIAGLPSVWKNKQKG